MPSDLKSFKIGIITASDRASQGSYEDKSGPAIESFFQEHIKNPLDTTRILIPDERDQLETQLIHLADTENCPLIITTGGTGPGPRDITPEATEAVCHKILPGFGEEMRRVSLTYVPTAILSRQTAGIRGNSLIINLPGSPKAISQCLGAVFAALPDCIDQLGGPRLEINDTKKVAFRPH